MMLEYILNLLSSTYVKICFIFKLSFNSSTFFIYFIMLSPYDLVFSSKFNHHVLCLNLGLKLL